jgi:hypothetical protein
MYLRTNSDYFAILIGYYDADGVCLLRGTRFVLFKATLKVFGARR